MNQSSEIITYLLRLTERDMEKMRSYYESTPPDALDREFAVVCQQFREADLQLHELMMDSLDESRCGWLRIFAVRMATVGARNKSKGMVLDALTALMLTVKRSEIYYPLMDLSVVYRSASLIGNPDEIFREAAALEPNAEAQGLALDWLKRSPHQQRLEAMGYREVDGPHGVIFVRMGQPIPKGLL